ncbi:hypothetical protein ACFS07_06250 [Undibacterium arcticum]
MWEKSPSRINHLSVFLGGRFTDSNNDYALSAHTLGKLIELLAPHAETGWTHGAGWVTDTMQRGDHVRALIVRLGAMATTDAALEISRLLGLHSLTKLKFALENARHQQILRQRENEFRFF